MEHKTVQELNALSLKAFGSSSRWHKLVNKGVPQLYERDREVMIVVEGTGKLGKNLYTDQKVMIKRYTVEEVRTLMVKTIENKEKAIKEAEEAAIAKLIADTVTTPGA